MSEEGKKPELVPFELRAVGPEVLAELFGCEPRTVLETIACRPGFPRRVQLRPARWIAGEVIKWRDRNRPGRAA